MIEHLSSPSLDGLICVGINHQTAPLEIRERVSISKDQIGEILSTLKQQTQIEEAVVLSTCNRTEIYAHAPSLEASKLIEQFLCYHGKMPAGFLAPHLYHFQERAALTQLFRVASSLDAAVLGEPQILGQVKEAFHFAEQAGATGRLLHRVFTHAFAAAKRVRSETQIGKNAVTIGFAAVELAKKIFGELNTISCLFVGVGEMSKLSARHFKHRGARLLFCNRSTQRAQAMASQLDGIVYPFSDLKLALIQADVVVTSTSAATYLISKKMVAETLKARRYRQMLFADMSVPRNIDPRIGQLDGIYIYDVDDLAKIVKENQSQREHHALLAEQLIGEETELLIQRLSEQRVAPLISAIHEQAHEIAQNELQRFILSSRSSWSSEEQVQVHQLVSSIVNKVLHKPVMELKELAAQCRHNAQVADRLPNIGH